VAVPAAGWYRDPIEGDYYVRYWDGRRWTDHVQNNPEALINPKWPVVPVDVAPLTDQAYPSGTPLLLQQANQSNLPMQLPVADRSNQAVTSLVLALIAVPLDCLVLLAGYVCSILAIIFAVRSMNSRLRQTAIAGLVIGIIALFVTILLHVIFALAFLGIIDVPGLDIPTFWTD
jgi:hypothetical protein